MKGRARATHVRVRLVVDIVVPSNWGDNATIGEVHRSALASARSSLMSGLVIDGLTQTCGQKTGALIVGTPEMDTVIVEDR